MSSASDQIWCCLAVSIVRGRHHLVVVIDQLEQRLFDVPRPTDQNVAAPHFFFDRQVFEERRDPLA